MAVISWFMKLGTAAKVAVVAAVGFTALPMLLIVGIITAGVASQTPSTASAPNSFADVPESSPSAAPEVTTEEVRTTTDVPFIQVTVQDAGVASGITAVTRPGVVGTREIVYSVTYIDGVETTRRVVSDTIVVAPVDEVTTVGTYVAPPPPPVAAPAPPPVAAPAPAAGGCDGNYTGACVPIASDVDCAGGSGNGPAYVTGPVTIIGSDIYDLDRDGDGIACD